MRKEFDKPGHDLKQRFDFYLRFTQAYNPRKICPEVGFSGMSL